MRIYTIILFAIIMATSISTVRAETSFPFGSSWSLSGREAPQTNKTKPLEHKRSSRKKTNTNKHSLPDPTSAPPPWSNEKPNTPQPSAIERMYAQRVIDPLGQFGYNMFGTVESKSSSPSTSAANQTNTNTPMGAVQDDFILASGDELEVIFTGQRTDRELYKVNSKGLLIINDLPPIPAAGRSIGQIRISVEAAAKNLHNTQAYISLSSVRQIGVLVIGHVKAPGRKNLTVFHTALDALMEAGGIDKTGSLRQIKLVRNGRSSIIDLYALLMHGSTNIDLRLRDGDRIIVPAIGPTVAVAGEAKRPAIFELLTSLNGMYHRPADRAQKLSLNEMLELAGGALAAGDNRYLKLSVTNDGNEQVTEIHDAFAPVFGDGAILTIAKGSEKRSGTIELVGHTNKPGIHALSENKTLTALINSQNIMDKDIYPLIAAIERWDPEQLTTQIINFPLRLVLKKEYDQTLKDGDIIHFFSNTQIRTLEQMNYDTDTDQGSYSAEDEDSFITDSNIAEHLRERSVFLRGAVRNSGAYPVSDEGTTLASLLSVAGNLTLEAATNNIEITSAKASSGKFFTKGQAGTQRMHVDLATTRAENVFLEAGDSVRINQKFNKIKDNSVLIYGEVNNPGRYDLVAGDKMSDLLARAGGLTTQAYPDGAIFSRASERRIEEARFRTHARQIRQSIAVAMQDNDGSNNNQISSAQIAEARALAQDLENIEGVGRITIEADPANLAINPELDLLLESDDYIYIPRRNLTVRVAGEILSPASLQFRQNKKSMDYIQEAGGFSYHADKDRAFVLYPDGSAKRLQVNAWNYNPDFIPPGSTIIIPRDPKPFDFIERTRDVTQIISNLAITGVFIDSLRD